MANGVFKKFKGFFALQALATIFLALGGLLMGNMGLLETGVKNTLKNLSFAFLSGSSLSGSELGVGDIGGLWDTFRNFAGFGASGYTNLPQFLQAVDITDVIAAGSGIIGYVLAAIDIGLQWMALRRLKRDLLEQGLAKDEKITFQRNGEESDAKEAIDYYLDRRRKGEWGQHLLFGMLPGILLGIRGFTFCVAGAQALMSVIAGGTALTIGSALAPLGLLFAGAIFMVAAYKHFKANNPDFEFKKMLEYIIRPFKEEGRFGFNTSDQQTEEERVTFKRASSDKTYDLEDTGAEVPAKRKPPAKQRPALAAASPSPGLG